MFKGRMVALWVVTVLIVLTVIWTEHSLNREDSANVDLVFGDTRSSRQLREQYESESEEESISLHADIQAREDQRQVDEQERLAEIKRQKEEKEKEEEQAKKESQESQEQEVATTASSDTPNRCGSRQSTGRSLGTFQATGYCSCEICNGQWVGSPTASGAMPQTGRTIAVDPNVIPLGSKVSVNGQTYVAEDTGSAINGNIIDIYFGSHSEALSWGRRSVTVKILD